MPLRWRVNRPYVAGYEFLNALQRELKFPSFCSFESNEEENYGIMQKKTKEAGLVGFEATQGVVTTNLSTVCLWIRKKKIPKRHGHADPLDLSKIIIA